MSEAGQVFIYAIGRPQGPVKIGVSSNPQARVGQIQTGCPFKVTLLHSAALPNRGEAEAQESIIHGVYEDRRIIGEWFKMDREIATEAIDCAIITAEAFKDRSNRL